MPLYGDLDRVAKGLAAIGIGPEDPIKPEQLFPLDQWHYQGTEAVRRAAQHLGLNSSCRVLDVGSGIGGPARFLAHTVGCQVVALELQPRLHEIAADLTRRCGLTELVTHECGDVLVHPLPEAAFDAVVSWLVVHHIPDRPGVCARLVRALRPGGGCYIEDLYVRSVLSDEDLQDVRTVLVGNTVTGIAEFAAELRAAGFVNVGETDLTSDTKAFVAERMLGWQRDFDDNSRRYGIATCTALGAFYATVARLFGSGSLGCVSLTANRP